MYTLFWSHFSASIAAHFCLEESGIRYEATLVDMSRGAHKEAAYLKINPAGKLPALKLPSGEVMTESAAICMLAADLSPGSGLAPAASDPKRGLHYMWLCYLTNTLQAAMLRYYYPDRITADAGGQEGVKALAVAEVAAIWSRIDAHLAGQGPWLLGDRFSAADAFCFMLSGWQDSCPGLHERFPAVKRLADLVAARPAIKRVLAMNQAT